MTTAPGFNSSINLTIYYISACSLNYIKGGHVRYRQYPENERNTRSPSHAINVSAQGRPHAAKPLRAGRCGWLLSGWLLSGSLDTLLGNREGSNAHFCVWASDCLKGHSQNSVFRRASRTGRSWCERQRYCLSIRSGVDVDRRSGCNRCLMRRWREGTWIRGTPRGCGFLSPAFHMGFIVRLCPPRKRFHSQKEAFGIAE